MRFIIFNINKDRNILIKNILILSVLMALCLQMYGTYWFRFDYKKDQIRRETGFIYRDPDISYDNIKSILSDKGIESVKLSYTVSRPLDIKGISKKEIEESEYFSGYKVMSYVKEKVNDSIYHGDMIDVLDDDNTIIIPAYIYEKYKLKLNDTITINNYDYIIKGADADDYDNSFITSFKGASAIGLKVKEINVFMKKGLKNDEIMRVEEKLTRILKKKPIEQDLSIYTNDGNTEVFQILTIVILISLSLVVLIYNYYLDIRKKRRIVYRFEGASASLMMKNYVIEILLIFLISTIVSALLVLLFNKVIFYGLFKVNRYNLPLENYFLIYGVYFTLYIILILFANKRLSKKRLLN